jgi:biotin carboxyl carrier protein
MKYIVKVADISYEVEIEDIYARPVIAHVNGEVFEVNPQDEAKQGLQTETKEPKLVDVLKQPIGPSRNSNNLTAPLPGTVTEIFVKVGDTIETGQVVLVIEAMKMKNSIRSTRAGKIADVWVSAGQTVAHKQALVRFE